MTTIEADIKRALLTRAEAFAASVALRAEMPGVPFDTVEGEVRWLTVDHFVNTNLNYGWSDRTQFQGILQICVVDTAQEGDLAPTEVCGAIVSYFDKNTVIRQGNVVVKIEVRPSVLTPIVDGQKSTYPVSIPYRAS
jgi:hypothetical protein